MKCEIFCTFLKTGHSTAFENYNSKERIFKSLVQTSFRVKPNPHHLLIFLFSRKEFFQSTRQSDRLMLHICNLKQFQFGKSWQIKLDFENTVFKQKLGPAQSKTTEREKLLLPRCRGAKQLMWYPARCTRCQALRDSDFVFQHHRTVPSNYALAALTENAANLKLNHGQSN